MGSTCGCCLAVSPISLPLVELGRSDDVDDRLRLACHRSKCLLRECESAIVLLRLLAVSEGIMAA